MQYKSQHDSIYLTWNVYDGLSRGYSRSEIYIDKEVFEFFLIKYNLSLERIKQLMNEREQHFAQFYADEKVLVSSMTFEQLEAHIEKLEEILLEGRARANAATDSKKERVRKLSDEEREKLITKPNLNVTDAINAVERRKERMSKMDKLIDSLRNLGHSEEEIKKLVGGVKVNETGVKATFQPAEKPAEKENVVAPLVYSDIPSLSIDLPSVSEVASPVKELGEQTEAEVKEEQDKPFDPGSLF